MGNRHIIGTDSIHGQNLDSFFDMQCIGIGIEGIAYSSGDIDIVPAVSSNPRSESNV